MIKLIDRSAKSGLIIASLIITVLAVTYGRRVRESKVLAPSVELRYTGHIDVDRAIDKVRSLPDVRQWLERSRENEEVKARAVIDAEMGSDGLIAVHAYHLVKDDQGMDELSYPRIEAHTATFNWYWVEPRMLVIVSSFNNAPSIER